MERTRIILYEKDPIIEADISRMLLRWGFEVIEFDKNHLLEFLTMERPTPSDLLVISNADPFLEAPYFLKMLGTALKNTPILIISALRPVDLAQLKQLSLPFKLLTKPFNAFQLREAVVTVGS